MEKSVLASELRQRQRELARVLLHKIDTISDAELIGIYGKALDRADLDGVIAESATADEFLAAARHAETRAVAAAAAA